MEGTSKNTKREPTMAESLSALLSMAIIITIGVLVFNIRVEFLILIAAAVAGILAKRTGMTWADMEETISQKLYKATPTIMLMWAIGVIIAALIFSGSIPMIIYYGFKIIDPQFVYVGAFLMCLIMSTITGTSWGSAGTAGVAFMGLAYGLGVSLPITAGAVIAGSIFGDKMSPLSETTNMAPLCTGDTLYQHIASMLWTTLPPAATCLIVYFIMGQRTPVGEVAMPESAVELMNALDSAYNWNILLLLPFVIVIGGAILKKPALLTILLAAFCGIILGAAYQGFSISDGFSAGLSGFNITMLEHGGFSAADSPASLATLLNRGGMKSMAGIIIIAYCGFSYAAIISKAGFLEKVLQPLSSKVNSRPKAMGLSLITSLLILLAAGSCYIAFIIVPEMYRKIFIKNGLGLPALSRSLEDIGTCFGCLIPWTMSGVYYADILGVPMYGPNSYAVWTILPYLTPVFAMLWATVGLGCFKPDEEETRRLLDQWSEEELQA